MEINNGLLGTTFVVFLVLKLIGVITWPWFWVFSPLIAGVAIFLVTFVVMLLVAKRQKWSR